MAAILRVKKISLHTSIVHVVHIFAPPYNYKGFCFVNVNGDEEDKVFEYKKNVIVI
jgi:hypothetical protein